MKKTPSRYERVKAFSPSSRYARTARVAYPVLVEAGERIAAAGVPFGDLTGIYRGVRGTVYVDNCCHVNALGNRIMAQAMAERIGG